MLLHEAQSMVEQESMEVLVYERQHLEDVLVQRAFGTIPAVNTQGRRPADKERAWQGRRSVPRAESSEVVESRATPRQILNPDDRSTRLRPLTFFESATIDVLAELTDGRPLPTLRQTRHATSSWVSSSRSGPRRPAKAPLARPKPPWPTKGSSSKSSGAMVRLVARWSLILVSHASCSSVNVVPACFCWASQFWKRSSTVSG